MPLLKQFLFILLLILLCTFSAQAQTARQHSHQANGWLMYFGDHRFKAKWGIHLEAQIRRAQIVSQAQQILLRTGLNYHVNAQTFFTAGYCFVQTYPYGAFPAKSAFPEHRIWEQLQLKNQYNCFEWVSRFRIEQRFSNLPVMIAMSGIYEPGDAVYTNRFRLLNRLSVPFSGKIIQDKSLYVTFYDEVMINAGKNTAANIFDQNRFYVAIGYKLPGLGRIEAGYLEQTLIKGDGIRIENNHTLQLGLSSTLDLLKKKN